MSTKPMDDYPYTIILMRSMTTGGNPCYVAVHPELPGCRGQGDTVDEARSDLLEARRLYIADMLESGEQPPMARIPGVQSEQTASASVPAAKTDWEGENLAIHTSASERAVRFDEVRVPEFVAA